MTAALTRPTSIVSIREYLDREHASEEKHEYWWGEVIAMTGGTFDHSRVATNIVCALYARLRHTPHLPHGNYLRVRINRTGRYVYPDATVVCGQPEFDPDDPRKTTILNPSVVVEVLSESSETRDLTAKLQAYTELRSVREYLVIDSRRRHAIAYTRDAADRWLVTLRHQPDDTLPIASLRIDLPLSAIYAGVDVPPIDAPPGATPPPTL
ncbi:MAG TPA: Uma2 family endonuclease [Tepidisphaeraceae bacterium]|nr:Uma2 family endonuclease [Tepidisphaeraceae bacterium]